MVLERFDCVVQSCGPKVAIACQDETLTYTELNHQINQLAQVLLRHGIQPQDRVGLFLDRGLTLVVALLALLRIGAVYTPLDPAYPQDRLNFMVADVQPRCIVTTQALQPRLATRVPFVLCLDHDGLTSSADDPTAPALAPLDPQALAYIMYTSGSTGHPKGVQMLRSSVDYYIQAVSAVIQPRSEDIYLHTASFSFSSSVRQLLVPLSQGATVILANKEQTRNPLMLLDLIKTQQVSISDTVASVWRSLLQSVKSLDPDTRQDLLSNDLRLVLLSGDVTFCPTLHAIRHDLTSHPDVINIYGQTETVGICAYPVPREFDQQDGYVPVGFPYPHNRTYIVNEALERVAPGEVGELWVAGGCVSAGYLGRPELTAQQFIPNPWAAEEDDRDYPGLFNRLYKTGDLARQLPDGALELRGRSDFQVKLRGLRIELGELESQLEQLPLVKEAIALAKEDPRQEKQLVAYVVLQPDAPDLSLRDLTHQIQQQLRAELPMEWVPSLIVPLAALPLTPNGKRDRLALPDPDWGGMSLGADATPSDDPTEQTLLRIWTELFNFVPNRQDNFFDLGGHSLLAVQLFAQIDHAFQRKLSFHHLLAHPTLADLAAYLRDSPPEEQSTLLVPLQTQGDRPPLFCIHAVGGGAMFYQALLPYLAPDQPVYGIQARGFDGIEPPLDQVEAMATLYLETIRQQYPDGMLYLLGHSFGGLIVYEMAQQLRQRGETPGLVAMIDTKTPALMQAPRSWRQTVKTTARNLWLMNADERMGYLKKTLTWFYRKRQMKRDRVYTEALKAQNVNLRMLNVLQPNYHAQDSYQPQPYDGDVEVYRAQLQSPRSAHNPTLGWGDLVQGKITVHTMPGRHLTMMKEPHVQALGQQINASLLSRHTLISELRRIAELQ
jgi:aspartate racemase